MNRRIKRFLAALLAAVMMVTMMPTVSLATWYGKSDTIGSAGEYYFYVDGNKESILVEGGSTAELTYDNYLKLAPSASNKKLVIYVDKDDVYQNRILDFGTEADASATSYDLDTTKFHTVSGKTITSWMVNGVATTNVNPSAISGNYIIAKANYETGTANITAGEHVTITGISPERAVYEVGETITVTAKADEGYDIAPNTTSFTVAAGTNNFTVMATPKTVQVNSVSYDYGATFTAPKAPTAPAGKNFVGWHGSNGKLYKAGESYTVDFTTDLTLTELYDDDTEYYFVKYYDADGSLFNIDVVDRSGDRTYTVYDKFPAGTTNIWYNEANDQPVTVNTFTLIGNLTLRAKMMQYKVTVQPTNNGTITVDPTGGAAGVGEQVSVTATPDADYELSALYYVAGGVKTELVPDTNGEAKFKMPAEDIEIFAEFTKQPGTTDHNVTWKAVDEDGTQVDTGTNNIVPSSTAKGGKPVILTYNAPEGYSVKSVEAIGASGNSYKVIAKSNRYSITMPEEDVQFVINLKAATYTVYFRADGKLVDKVTIKHNDTVKAPDIPEKEGYAEDEWVNAATNAKYDAAAKVTADTTYNATYTAKEYKVSYENGVVKDQNVSYGATFTAPIVADVVFWKSSDGRTMEPGKDYKVTEDITLTAVYKQVGQILVTYVDMDGKIVGYDTVNKDAGFKTKDYTVNGYTDLQWSWTDGGTTSYVTVDKVLTSGLSKNTILTLTGKAAAFNITKNDVTGADSADYGDVVTVKVNKTAKQEFVGISVVGTTSGKAYSVDTITVGDSYSFVMPAEDVTVTATLKDIPDNAFAVKFIADGNVVDIQSVTDGQFAAVPANNPTKTGYTFQHWSADGKNPVDVAATAITKDTTFYAVFEVNKATLTFDSNGGSSVASIDASYGETAVLPVAPTKADSEFVGWMDTDTGLVYSENAKYSVTGNASFKAVWAAEDQFVVTFKDTTGALHGYFTVDKGATVTAPAAPTAPTGKSFTEWKSGTTVLNPGETSPAITGNTEFTAAYNDVDYALTVDGTDAGITAGNYKYGEVITFTPDDVSNHQNVKAVYISYNGETQMLYSTSGTYTFTMPAYATTLHVVREDVMWNIRFIVDGALYQSASVKDGDQITAPTAPTKAGYTFEGWSEDGTNVITLPNATKNAEYTAVFAAEDYSITVDKGSVDNNTVQYNGKFQLTAPTGADAKDFIGWSGSDGHYYVAGQTYTFKGTEDLTLTAVYGSNTEYYVVKYLYQDGSVYSFELVDKKGNTDITLPQYPDVEGYTATNWTANNTAYEAGRDYTVTADTEFTLAATAKDYTIKVVDGSVTAGGTTNGASATVAYGGTFELTAPANVPAGKNFVGWAGNDGHYYVAGQTYTFKGTEDLTLTAVYDNNTEYYVVKYLYPNGSVYNFQLVDKSNTDITLPQYPDVEGYTATNWTANNTAYEAGRDYKVTADTEFTLAATANNYTIAVDDGFVVVNTNTGTKQTVAYGGTFELTAPANVPAGKNFLGWAGTDGNFYIDGTTYTFKGTENLDLTAVYENDTKYQLAKFYAADGTLANVRLVDSDMTSIVIPGTTDDKWTYTNQNGGTVTVAGGDTVTVSEIKADSNGELVFNAVAKTYKAYWKSVDVNGVEIADAGATGTNPAPSVDEGKTATITYTGLNTEKYTLKAYYAVGETTGRHYGVVSIGGDQYVLKSMPNENVTFYFVLTANQYSVTFKSADGKQLQTGSYALNDKVSIPRETAIAEAKPGYIFNGWDCDVTGIPGILENATEYILSIPQNVVYTAKYKAIDYAVATQADAHSTITVTDPAPLGTVTAGQDITFKVDANDGYTVSGVTVKETVSGKLVPLAYDGTSYQFTMPAASVTIYSTAVVNKYTVTFVDDDNTLLGTVPVDHNAVVNAADAPTATKAGFDFDKWVIIPDGTQQFRIGTDPVDKNLTVKATYIGKNHTVVKGTVGNLKTLNAWETTPFYITAVNSADLLNASTSTTLNTQTGKLVYFEAEPATGYTIKNIYVTAADGSQISVDVQRYSYDAATDHYIMYFTMPDYNMQINVETEAKQFMVSVDSNNVKGGTHKINGYSTDNRKITVGENVTIPVTANEGYVIEKIETSYVNDKNATVTTLGSIAYNNTTAKVGDTLNATSAELSFTMVPYPVEVKITYKTLTYNVDVEESNKLTYRPTIKAGGTTEDAESLDDDYTVKGKVYLVNRNGDELATQKRQVQSVAIDVPGNARYETNQTVHFKVETYTGYELDKLYATYANGTKTAVITPLDKNGIYHLTMPTDDVTITATFKEVRNDVIKDASDEEHGKVVVSEIARGTTTPVKESNDKRTSVQYKNDVNVTVTPDAGYYVTNIAYTLEDGSVVDFHYQGSTEKPGYTSDKAASTNYTVPGQDDTAHDITFTMPATNVELTVKYAPINYVVSKDYTAAEVDTFDIENKTDDTASLDQANVGDKMLITTKPAHGYDIQQVYITDVNGNTVGIHSESTKDENGGTYSFIMPSEDVTVHVVTVKHAFTVTYRDSAGDVTSEEVKFEENTTKADKLPNNAPDGYHFIGWSSDDVKDNTNHPSRDNADFVIVKDTIIEAQYAKDETDVKFAASENGKVKYTTKPDDYAAFTEDTKEFGDTIKFTAEPDSGYVVDTIIVSTKNSEGEDYNVKFTDTVNGLTHECEFTIPATYKANLDDVNSEAIDVTVTFKKAEYLLTDKSAEHHGEVSVNGAVTTQSQFAYDYLDNVNITVTPDAGWYVKSITATGTAAGSTFKETATGTKPAVDGVGTPLTLTFDMPHEDVDFDVVYEKIDYSITNTPTEGGTVTTDPANTAVLDETVKVHVKPNTGYQLKNLTVTYDNGEKSCKLTQDKKDANEFTFTMPAAGVTVTAEFETVTYNVTAELNGNGKFTINGDYTYATTSRYLDTVTVDVKPDAGWKVKSVVVNDGAVAVNDEGNNKYTFKMPYNDVHVVITLEKIDYTIKTVATPNEGGTVTTTPASNAQVDDVVQVHVAPADGYKLKKLTVTYADGKKSRQLTQVGSNEYTFTMPADDVVVTAEFETESYYVTASINGNGKFTLNEDYTYMTTSRYLDTVTVNVKPDAGWRVQSVVANDGSVAVTDEGNGKYTFTMPHKNVNVVITLEKIPYTVDSFAVNYYEDGHGKVTADKTTANVGDKINITADPDEGYHVKDIKVVDKSGNSVPVSIVSEDKDYTKVYSFTMPAEAVDVTVSFSVNASSYYTDVRSDKWYNDAVEFVTDRGYFKGVSADKFGPMINMSRGMFVTVLGRIDADINGLDVSSYDIAKTSFTDVGASQYYAKYIAWAAENGIVTGRTAQTFDPDGNVSREEMAAIMYRYCDYLGLDMSLQNQDFMNRYTDTGDIHNYAKTAVSWAVGTGLIQGVSSTSISPRTFANRAQVAQVIKNLSDKVLFNQG